MTYLPQLDYFATKMAQLKSLLDLTDRKVALPHVIYLKMFLEKEKTPHIR